MADIVDSIVVSDKRRDDGVLMGIRAFFMRFSYASQAIVFWLIHTITDFNADPTSPAAKMGISLHMAAIPSLFFLAGAIVFLKMNTLDPEKDRGEQTTVGHAGHLRPGNRYTWFPRNILVPGGANDDRDPAEI